MGKKLLAAVLGGLTFFAWSSVAHMATGLGEVGVQEIPNEQAVVAAMKANMPASGLYILPGWGLPGEATHAQKMEAMKSGAMQAKIKAGPTGMLVYNAGPGEMLTPRQLLTELGINIAQMLLVVMLLGQTAIASFAGRWRFITIAGVLAAISTNVSYWNWYHFPGNYTIAAILSIAAGYVISGLVAAAIVKPAAANTAARSAGA